MGIKALIVKAGWYDYTVSNPFMTKGQVAKAREYAKGGWFNDSKTYAETHKEDELLGGLKSMLRPDALPANRLAGKTLYLFQRFVRKYSDVRGKVLVGRSIEEQAGAKRCEDVDKNAHERNEAIRQEWLQKEMVRKLSERCLLIKDKPYRRH